MRFIECAQILLSCFTVTFER
ncbi:hypothetical protein Gorai_016438 [Gossypium raimondii]|uniref:Uncharacterized protein n=1 Tax=Gossypium raimondii TaxID=29730 RepID=A0A7J8P8S4_GOSRA|nr:hypothetical protein [Gossypium raimondii]